MTQLKETPSLQEKSSIESSTVKAYPGIIVQCYGTLAEITQNSLIGSRRDGSFSTFGGSGS